MYCTTFIVYSVFWFLTLKRSKIYIFYIKKIVILNTMFIYFLFLKSFWLLFFFFFFCSLPAHSDGAEGRLLPKRVERLVDHSAGKASPLRGGKKVCFGSVISYLPIQTSPTARRARVCERECADQSEPEGERERGREREGERVSKQRGRHSILSPTPHQTTGGRGQAQTANQIRSWQPALSLLQTIDRLHVKEFST